MIKIEVVETETKLSLIERSNKANMLFALSQEQSNASPPSTHEDVNIKTTTNNTKASENVKQIGQLENTEIIVEIHSVSQSFTIKELSQLSYFKARFSSRWLKNIGSFDNQTKIQLFPSNNNTNNNTFSCFNQTQFNFTCRDLRLLLKCISISKIPESLCLELNELESLLYCNDYLNPQPPQSQSFVINQEILVNYFRNRVPSLHKDKRDEFLSNCTHPTLRNALLQLSNEYKTFMDQSKNKLFSGIISFGNLEDKIQSKNSYHYINTLLERVKLDGETATKLFESQFEVIADFQLDSREKAHLVQKFGAVNEDKDLWQEVSHHYTLSIGIKNFAYTYPNDDGDNKENKENSEESDSNSKNKKKSKSILHRLWPLCENGRYLTSTTFEKIDKMIEKILNPKMNDCLIVGVKHIDENGVNNTDASGFKKGKHGQMSFIVTFLYRLLVVMMNGYLTQNDLRLINTNYININSLIQSIMMIAARYHYPVPFFYREYCVVPNFLSENENENLVLLMCKLTDKYLPRSFLCRLNIGSLRSVKETITYWLRLLKNALLKCSKEFVTKEMCQWFPILHDRERKWLIKAVERVKKSDKYKPSLNENDDDDNDGDNNNSDNNINNKNYFDDEMIEEIIQLNNCDCEKVAAEWIINELIQTTDQCFTFGIYLSNYVVFDGNQENSREEKAFPQIYIDFMKKHCGISWNLIMPR